MRTIAIYKRVSACNWLPGKAFRTEFGLKPWMKGEGPWVIIATPDEWKAIEKGGKVLLKDGRGSAHTLPSIIYNVDPSKFHGQVKIIKPEKA